MRNLIIIVISVFCFSSCNSLHEEYNVNYKKHQELIAQINQYFKNTHPVELQIQNYYTENFVFHYMIAGNKKGIDVSKSQYLDGFINMKKNNKSIEIGHSIYLPGLDEHTFEIDGSVRIYYGATMTQDNKSVDFSGYQTINFEDGKISEIWEWADYGGVNNQLFNY
tara:strand:- start:404 stop:901 length:498 start_codon:yes stop_codon:yes gene_type:complete